MKEKALLVGLKLPQDSEQPFLDSMNELSRLVITAGGEIVDTMIQNRKEIDNRTYIGKGKIEEINTIYDPSEIDVVIFNHELSPAQSRNISAALEKRVITRSELIMDIFAIHAHTRTAKYQVELAQLKYQLPRLKGESTNLSRTGGGIGTRGPGEQKLETDRRFLRKRIDHIEGKLKLIEKTKQTQSKQRSKEYKAAIIGYTNSGKSTLLNLISKSDILAEDKLFATLDTTTRKVWLGDGIEVLFTDTVGFIKDLPHSLIQSFHSTLSDTLNAELLVHIVDASSSYFRDQIKTVNDTLAEIEAHELPMLMVFNKIDAITPEAMMDLRLEYPDAIFISAKKDTNIDLLRSMIHDSAKKSHIFAHRFKNDPPSQGNNYE